MKAHWHPKGRLNPRYRTGLKIKGHPYAGIYNTWQNMKARCLRKNSEKYHRYGGRGITIYKDWLDIEKFYQWAISSGYIPGMTLDRINNDGNYEPGNCRWVTKAENARKKSTTKLSKDDAADIRMRLAEGVSEVDLANEYGVTHGSVWFIRNGYTHVADGKCTEMLKARQAIEKPANPLTY